jgi:mannitol-1-phosphate/altronate dehydrogenase
VHQAFYIDRFLALPGQNVWGIVGIGLSGGERGRKKADQFRSQDCLYSLTVAPAKGDTSVRVIGRPARLPARAGAVGRSARVVELATST